MRSSADSEVKIAYSWHIACLNSYEIDSKFEDLQPISQLKVGDKVLALS